MILMLFQNRKHGHFLSVIYRETKHSVDNWNFKRLNFLRLRKITKIVLIVLALKFCDPSGNVV